MFGVFSSILDFLIVALCWLTMAFSAVIYRGRGSRTFLYMTVFAAALLLAEMELRAVEIGSPVAQWIGMVFENLSVVVFKSVIYAVLAALQLLILFRILEKKVGTGWILITVLLALWLVVFPLRKTWTGINAILYLLPYQVYIIALAGLGLRHLKMLPPRPHFPVVRGLLICTVILTILSAAEDTFTIVRLGIHTDLSAVMSGEMKERNLCEGILDVVLLGGMSFACSKILLGTLSTAPSEVPIQPVKNLSVTAEHFADAIGLSKREKEVLPLLLENLSIVQIAEALFISQGTVKSHTHNIYQKAGVANRVELIQKASAVSENTEG